jgi:hypothetical protein
MHQREILQGQNRRYRLGRAAPAYGSTGSGRLTPPANAVGYFDQVCRILRLEEMLVAANT